MGIISDYRRNTMISLNVLKEERQNLFNDITKHYSAIYEGLHEFQSKNVRDLYFQSYFMEWLDRHWSDLTIHINATSEELSKNDKKEISLFFAEYFSLFIDELTNTSSIADSASQPLIQAKKKIIDNMISFSYDWEERSNQLKVDQKKHKEHFKKIIEQAKNKKESFE